MKNRNYYLVLGQFSLAASILLNHFVQGQDFLVGFFTGLAIAFNLAYLIKMKINKQKD